MMTGSSVRPPQPETARMIIETRLPAEVSAMPDPLGLSEMGSRAPRPDPVAVAGRELPLDALRGLIMMLMALDHASAFIARKHSFEVWGMSLPVYDDPLRFLTRLTSHLCIRRAWSSSS